MLDAATTIAISTRAPARGHVRVLAARELPLFRDHLLRLDRESRRDRFNGSLDDEWVARYAEKSVNTGTVILAYFEDGIVRGAAELHQADLSPDSLPEIAFSVESIVRRKGVGSILFTRLIAKARSMGYAKLRITTGAQNDAMRALANKFGAHLSFRHGESTGVLDLRDPMGVGLVAQPKTSALDVARAVADYNRAYWGMWFKLAGWGKSS
ncbi:GNAT family N-acetyltransferase [Tardiphaga robiniae]|uniref:Acetyltransferase n=1 Tax=Tardiphaga robiniae TaxID=943830 RepID=A0A163XYZ4_9BRAD|nr:GNAT family N-acetyltransferase [Tardiphaga robiniae]KZD21586.1 acetyltransferase [Tardiphaga robiniae]